MVQLPSDPAPQAFDGGLRLRDDEPLPEPDVAPEAMAPQSPPQMDSEPFAEFVHPAPGGRRAWVQLAKSLVYPCTTPAWLHLLAWVGAIAVERVLSLVLPLFTILGTILARLISLMVFGWLCAYVYSLIRTTAEDPAQPPEWPDVTDYMEDAVKPAFLFLGAVVLAFGPILLVRQFITRLDPGLEYALLAWGIVYLPMSVLCIAMTEDVGGLMPHIVFRAILQVPLRYAAVCLLCVAGAKLAIAWDGLLAIRLSFGYGSADPLRAMDLFVVLVIARSLGLLYHTARDRLKWLGG